jgi:hypothetical protein
MTWWPDVRQGDSGAGWRATNPELTSAGVSLVVVSGDLIDGTITPKLLDRM